MANKPTKYFQNGNFTQKYFQQRRKHVTAEPWYHVTSESVLLYRGVLTLEVKHYNAVLLWGKVSMTVRCLIFQRVFDVWLKRLDAVTFYP